MGRGDIRRRLSKTLRRLDEFNDHFEELRVREEGGEVEWTEEARRSGCFMGQLTEWFSDGALEEEVSASLHRRTASLAGW